MKGIIKISIRLFLVFNIFNFINNLASSINNFISWYKYIETNSSDMKIIEIIELYLPFIIVWCIFIFIIIILWIKTENISDKIISASKIDNINITLDYENILSLCIIILGIYLILDALPRTFSYLGNLLISKSRFVDKDYLKEYTIKEIVEIIGILLKIFTAFIIIKHNRKIIKKIIELNKKSNVA